MFEPLTGAVTKLACGVLLLAGLLLLASAAACNDGGPSGDVPKEVLPDDFPVYPQARLLEGSASDNQLSARYETGDSRQEIVDFYEVALYENRWLLEHIVEPADQKNTTVILFGRAEKKDDTFFATHRGVITARGDPAGNGKTEISVLIELFGSALTATPSPG